MKEKLSVCLPTRWTAEQHDIISREAWKRRKSASGFMREIVTEYLAKEGVILPPQKEHWYEAMAKERGVDNEQA